MKNLGLPPWIIIFILLPLLLAAILFFFYRGELGLLV